MKPLTSVNLAHEEQIRSLGIGLEKFAHVPPFRVVDDRLGRRHWKKKKKGKRKRMGNNDEANTSIEVTRIIGGREGMQRRGRNDFFEVVIVGRDYANTSYSPSFIARFLSRSTPPFRLVRVVPSPPNRPIFLGKQHFLRIPPPTNFIVIDSLFADRGRSRMNAHASHGEAFSTLLGKGKGKGREWVARRRSHESFPSPLNITYAKPEKLCVENSNRLVA